MTRKHRKVSIQQVADEAGISPTTVSFIMNGKGRISEATRANVLAIADRLGYRPSAAAIALATGRSNILALAFPRAYTPPFGLTEIDYFDRAIRAATKHALGLSYSLIIIPPGQEASLVARMPLDGVVVFDPVRDEPLTGDPRRMPPIVTVGRVLDGGDDLTYVDNDHVEGTARVLDHLVAVGAPEPALFVADLRDSYTADCQSAYEKWCAAHGVAVSSHALLPQNRASVTAALESLAGRGRPLGVYANDDALSRSVVHCAAEMGLRIPEDLMLVAGSDRTDFAGFGIDLTTLSVDPGNLAVAAIDLLVARLTADTPPASRILPTRLEVRASTART